METIFGVRKKDGGTVYKDGKELNIRSPRDSIVNKIALITEDRKFTGLNLQGTVKENITLAYLRDGLSRKGFISAGKEAAEADKYIQELRIKTPGRDTSGWRSQWRKSAENRSGKMAADRTGCHYPG